MYKLFFWVFLVLRNGTDNQDLNMTKNATTISQGNQKLFSYSNICVECGQSWLKQGLSGGCTKPDFFRNLWPTLCLHTAKRKTS